MNLIYFILCSFGITQILVYGSIFNSIRPTTGKLGELFHCPLCTGFWVGIILWALNSYTALFSFDSNPVTGFLLGCLSSGTAYLLSMLVDDDGIRFTRSTK